ncbi:putative proline-rich receptor-like protein kinase PERK13 [Iris pallida]|uniref:Proline-rich receptor-like protein kinase PERK13 n=1 Tax=Iris pallida TaxID=29817 RepID=A0AAX6HF77_IRIPA|nr:putative proline-rich receptor-like protein kinase PERK13 [Iris pallida]
MASSSTSTSLLLLISLLSVLPLLSSARPCKTLFVSYTFSSGDDVVGTTTSPVRFFSVYRVVSPRPIRFAESDTVEDGPRRPALRLAHPQRPHAAVAAGRSSLVDSARDILVVLAGLLFGVGCGAITAATMYLAWSLVVNQHQICGARGDDSDGDYAYEAADSPKKAGYVTMVQEPLLAAPAATKEGYEGK